MLNHTSGTMHMWMFEPGDGTSYRVLFGRLPPTNALFAGYIVFGMAEGSDALITLAFTGDGDQISADSFAQHWHTATFTNAWGDPGYIERTTYTVIAALVGLPGIEPPGAWAADWRTRLPVAALG